MGNNMGKQKRPPRQVWLVVEVDGRPLNEVFRLRDDAQSHVDRYGWTDDNDIAQLRVAGPFVLAERARQR